MQTYAIVVGTDPATAEAEYREFAGQEIFGPYPSYEAAEAAVASVKAEWAQQPAEAFVYGTPFAYSRPIRTFSAERVARNWYMETAGA